MNNERHASTKTQEWYGAILSFIYFFSILASYYVIRPMRDQLAADLGSAHLPWFFAATFLMTLLLTPLFAWVVSKWPRKKVMPLVNLFFIACQMLFIFLFQHQDLLSRQHLGLAFFVWVSVFNLFVVSVFWSFMTDIWNDEQACRFFPLIALGGTAGAIAGPVLTTNLVELIGFTSLLVVSSFFLAIAILCILLLGRWAHKYGVHRNEPNSETALGGGMLDGLKQLFSNRFIAIMAVMMLLNDAIGTIAYVLITDYSGATFHHDVIAQTRFAANMDLSANILQVLVQVIITRWLLMRYGASVVFVIWACMIVFFCLSMVVIHDPYALAIGMMPWLAVVQIMTRALSYGMIQPARESLYTLVPRSLRYKGKNAVDTVVWRLGDVASSSAMNLFRGLGVNVIGFSIFWAALAAASGWIGWRLARRVEKGAFLPSTDKNLE